MGSECFQKELESLNLNATAYNEQIFADAGVSPEELQQIATDIGRDGALVYTGALQKIQRALKNNPGPYQEIQAIQRKCAIELSSPPDSNEVTSYFGFTLELALLAEFTVGIIEDNYPNGQSFLRLCLGAGPKVLGQGAIAAGTMTNSNDPADLACVSVWATADAALGYGAGISGGIGFNGKRMWDFNVGLGLGIGAAVSTCATIPLPEPVSPTSPPTSSPSPTWAPLGIYPTSSPYPTSDLSYFPSASDLS